MLEGNVPPKVVELSDGACVVSDVFSQESQTFPPTIPGAIQASVETGVPLSDILKVKPGRLVHTSRT